MIIKHPTKYKRYTKSKNPYKILRVPHNATPEQIEKAYHKQCIQHHPDHGGDTEYFKKIQQAYETLKSGKKQAQDYCSTAASIIKNALVAAVRNTHTTPEKEARKEIESIIRQAEIEQSEAKQKINKAKKILQTYQKHNTGPTAKEVSKLMQEDIRASEITIKNNEKMLKKYKEAYTIIKEMKWEPQNPFNKNNDYYNPGGIGWLTKWS